MSIIIDRFPSDKCYFDDYTIVAIDVIRASTTAVTAASAGRRCFAVASLEEAFQRQKEFPDCLLAGEIAGIMPEGFDLNNSPATLARRSDLQRPLVLLSSAGTKLMVESCIFADTYVACLRNYKAVAAHIAERHDRIALLGAATHGEFREEDRLCCAWIASELVKCGHKPENHETREVMEQWSQASVEACTGGNSAAYLRRSGQLHDLEFILSHVNDVVAVFRLADGELVCDTGTMTLEEQPVEAPGPIAA